MIHPRYYLQIQDNYTTASSTIILSYLGQVGHAVERQLLVLQQSQQRYLAVRENVYFLIHHTVQHIPIRCHGIYMKLFCDTTIIV